MSVSTSPCDAVPLLCPVMDEVHRREQEEEGEELNLDPEREAYYKDDPKKALKKFFDREGDLFMRTCTCTCTCIGTSYM